MKQFYLLFTSFLLISNVNFAQTQETASEIKELNEFHKVIYKIWHNAWPKKIYQCFKLYCRKLRMVTTRADGFWDSGAV